MFTTVCVLLFTVAVFKMGQEYGEKQESSRSLLALEAAEIRDKVRALEKAREKATSDTLSQDILDSAQRRIVALEEELKVIKGG